MQELGRKHEEFALALEGNVNCIASWRKFELRIGGKREWYPVLQVLVRQHDEE